MFYNLFMKNCIKSLLKEKNITMKQMSKDLNVSYNTLQNYIYGTREPDQQMLVNIANYLNVTVDKVLNNEKNNSIKISIEDFNEIQSLQQKLDEICKKYR